MHAKGKTLLLSIIIDFWKYRYYMHASHHGLAGLSKISDTRHFDRAAGNPDDWNYNVEDLITTDYKAKDIDTKNYGGIDLNSKN